MNTVLSKNAPLTPNGAETVADLLSRHGIDPAARFIAVSVNGSVVRRGAWQTTRLTLGDAVEVVRPFQGG
jgi:sulfur carrier protein